MSTSNLNIPKPRVQKVCTLWTHDDNFSRDDIVFNGEKFPELPTTPGTLLQIVAVDSGTAVRDFQSNVSSTQHHPSQARSRDATHDTGVSHTPQRTRRESTTVTINENGSKVPGGRDMDEEKAFVFSVAALPADLKSKHANLQVMSMRDFYRLILTMYQGFDCREDCKGLWVPQSNAGGRG
jgi:hypothetical protein